MLRRERRSRPGGSGPHPKATGWCPHASRFDRLDHLDDASLRVAHDLLAVAAPNVTHLRQQPLGLFEGVELQVDQNVVRIFDRSQDLISTNTRPFAVSRVAIECLLPAGEARDCMFDSQSWHGWLL